MIIKKNVPIGYLFNKIKLDLFIVLIITVLASIFLEFSANKIPEMPLNIPAFLGTAISILLSFKMAQSYDRWWEARQIWGAIVNDSRTFVLQLQTYTPTESIKLINTMAMRQISWCYSLSNKLRGLPTNQKTIEHMEANEWNEIQHKNHIPLALLKKHIQDLKVLRNTNQHDGFAHSQIDSTIARLTESMGKAERIKNTVFPTTYRYILHISIYVFIVALDISLKNIHYFYQIPLLMVIASIFFLLEKSSTNLQDPFNNDPTDTPMTAICETIETNIKELTNVPFSTPKKGKKSFYQM